MGTVREIKDRETLHKLLIDDRISAAYHLGDLDPRYFDYCRWWAASETEGAEPSVMLLYTGLRMPAVLTLGDPDGVEAVFDDPAVRAALPDRFYAHVMSGHFAALQSRYHIDDMQSMVRMGLGRDDFRVPDDLNLDGVGPVSHADTASLMSLYQHYPDNFFEPYQLETGYYYGSRVDGELVAVAGIHVFSEQYDVACVGNIVTRPDFRRQGHSRRCTTRLLQALFERVSLVALNVQKENQAARKVYQRLGFHDHVRYLEGLVTRR